jgi:hypothetical protein
MLMPEPLIDDETYAELRELEVSAMTLTADLYRSPAKDGDGKFGEPEQINDEPLACEVIPVGLAEKRGIAPPGLAGGQADSVGLLPYGTDIKEGDELHIDVTVYTVGGVARHSTVVACALSEMRG